MPNVEAAASESVLLAHQEKTMVYLEDGYIVIRQTDREDPDGRDDVVKIAVGNAELLRLRIEELEKQARNLPA